MLITHSSRAVLTEFNVPLINVGETRGKNKRVKVTRRNETAPTEKPFSHLKIQTYCCPMPILSLTWFWRLIADLTDSLKLSIYFKKL
jgi:hypothetical protein